MDSVDDRDEAAIVDDDDSPLSDGDWEWESEYLPLVHDLRGETHAENQAHCTARIAFLNLLASHGDTMEAFLRWQHVSPLGNAAVAVADILDEIARLNGFQDRFQLWTPEGLRILNEDSFTVTLPDDTDSAEIERIRRLPATASDALNRMLDETARDHSEIWNSAIDLTRQSWGLPWPWVAVEIFQLWLLSTVYGAIGRTVRINYWYEPHTAWDEPMEPFRFSFESRPNETIWECLTRFADSVMDEVLPAFANAVKRAIPNVPAVDRGRMSDPARIEMYVGWFYRNRLCGESIRSIAHSLAGGDNDTRRHVRYGIERAGYWLGLSSYGWDDPGKNSSDAA